MKSFKPAPMLAAAVFLGFTIGCSPSKKKADTRIVIKGDPAAFVSQTVLNQNQEIPAATFADGSKWQTQIVAFTEEPAGNPSSAKSGQEPDAADGPSFTSGDSSLTVLRTADQVVISQRGSKDSPKYEFRITGSTMRLTRISQGAYDSDKIPGFKFLHTSYSPDLRRLSFLTYVGGTQGRELVAHYIYLDGPSDPDSLKSRLGFNYLFGRGYKLKWSQNQELLVCAPPTPGLAQGVTDAVALWSQALGAGLKFTAREIAHCPPFSDVNTRTYTHVQGWVEYATPNISLMGYTYLIPNWADLNAMDADVFILMSEYQKMTPFNLRDPEVLNREYIRESFAKTALHEIGHLLGLDHQFDGTPSIMSYDDHPFALSDYDTKAIQALYGPSALDVVKNIFGL